MRTGDGRGRRRGRGRPRQGRGHGPSLQAGRGRWQGQLPRQVKIARGSWEGADGELEPDWA